MSSPAPPHFQRPDLDGSLGATFVGLVATSILFGITLLQTFYYYVTFRDDQIGLKLLVGVLSALDTAQLIMVAHGLYYYTITSFGLYPNLNNVIWSFTADVFLTSVIAVIVQLYLIRRVWILSGKNIWLSAFLTALSLFAFASGMAYGVRLAQIPKQSQIEKIIYLIRMALSGTVAVDVCITIALVYFLRKNRSGMKSTDSVVHFLVVFTINTGAVTSLAALMDVILHATLETTLAFLTFYVMLSKLYVNSLLATLNARTVLRGERSLHIRSNEVMAFGPNDQLHLSTNKSTTVGTIGTMMFSAPQTQSMDSEAHGLSSSSKHHGYV
ncbi:hypothetical protein OF83DRAFT_1112129 [Amylostereum chailletii]|nr:hypothetical protein OF83DRAFT_1112129 [Amylostereum chailletii]